MAIPVLERIARGVVYVWSGDDSVQVAEGVAGWVLPSQAESVAPEADRVEVAPLSGEQDARVRFLGAPACYYEAGRLACRSRRATVKDEPVTTRGDELVSWVEALPLAAAQDLYVLIRALTSGRDPAVVYAEALARVRAAAGD